MRAFALVAFFIITGCASAPEPNPWDRLEVPRETSTNPLMLPQMPSPAISGETAIFTRDQIEDVTAYVNACKANTEIAEKNARVIDEYGIALEGLKSAGQAQYDLAQYRQKMLKDQERAFFWERFALYSTILLTGGAAIIN